MNRIKCARKKGGMNEKSTENPQYKSVRASER
jgi:hypothetical protein